LSGYYFLLSRFGFLAIIWKACIRCDVVWEWRGVSFGRACCTHLCSLNFRINHQHYHLRSWRSRKPFRFSEDWSLFRSRIGAPSSPRKVGHLCLGAFPLAGAWRCDNIWLSPIANMTTTRNAATRPKKSGSARKQLQQIPLEQSAGNTTKKVSWAKLRPAKKQQSRAHSTMTDNLSPRRAVWVHSGAISRAHAVPNLGEATARARNLEGRHT